MTKLMFAWVAAIALTACPKKHDPGGEAIATMTEFKDKICACKTPACAQPIADDETKWSQAMAKDKLSEVETKQVDDIRQQLAKCLADATKVGTEAAGSGSAK